MAYQLGDTILDAHYDSFADSTNLVWGRQGTKNLAPNTAFKWYEGTIPNGYASYNNGGISVTHAALGAVGVFGTSAHRVTANANATLSLGVYTTASLAHGGCLPWTASATYTISFYAKAGSAGAVGFQMYGLYTNMGFTSPTEISNPTLTTDWQRYVFSGVAGNNAANVTGELFLSWKTSGTLPSGASLDFCAVQVETGGSVTSYEPDSCTGMGQWGTVANVAVGDTVSATQWSTLLSKITSAWNHQGFAGRPLTSITPPVAGDTISAFTALQGNVNAIRTNPFDCGGSGTDITAGGVVSRTGSWTVQTVMEFNITWTDVHAMRYFFNSGGQIRFTSSRSGGTAHSKNTDWTNLCSNMGTLVINNGVGASTLAGTAYNAGVTKVGGGGSPTSLLTAYGFYKARSTWQEIFLQYSPTAPYTANYIQLHLIRPSQNQIRFHLYFQDNATDNSIPASVDVIDGTVTGTCVVRPPYTTYLEGSSWGTPTISGSVIAVS